MIVQSVFISNCKKMGAYRRSRHSTSRVKIDVEKKIVNKTFTRVGRANYFRKFPKIFDREVYWLRRISNEISPKFISSSKRVKTITMTYEGVYLTRENMPTDWEDQIKNILDILKKCGCNHNDIKPSELLILDGRIKLIDYGWATSIGSSIPTNWPRGLGDKFKYGIHNFSDEYSINKSIKWILDND